MDTYGDMVTLLLCFFVLLYSMSSISQEKWAALAMSFNPDAVTTTKETPGGEGPNADVDEGTGGPLTQDAIDKSMESLYEQIQEFVQSSEERKNISLFREGGRVFISFNQTVFFDGEQATLREESKPVLNAVSDILDSCAQAIDEVQVLGHTAQGNPRRANNPRNDRTLASKRATNVVIYIQERSKALDPGRLVSVGIGQHRPVSSNDTAEGRAKNRRVEMIISGRNLEKELQGNIPEYWTTGS